MFFPLPTCIRKNYSVYAWMHFFCNSMNDSCWCVFFCCNFVALWIEIHSVASGGWELIFFFRFHFSIIRFSSLIRILLSIYYMSKLLDLTNCVYCYFNDDLRKNWSQTVFYNNLMEKNDSKLRIEWSRKISLQSGNSSELQHHRFENCYRS